MPGPWLRWLLVLGVVFACGCTGTAPVNILAPTIQVESGDGQTGNVGTELPLPLVVAVRDHTGDPIAGVAITFTIVEGDGTLSSADATTDALGLAETRLTLGATPGANSVTASSGPTRSVTFSATGISTVASVLYSTQIKPIIDEQCVGCHQYEASAQFTELTTYTKVRFGLSYFTSAPLVVANEPDVSVLIQKLTPPGSMYAMLGADAATRDARLALFRDWVAQGAFNTAVGAPAKVGVVSGNNQTATISSALAAPLVVRVMDADDNPVAGATVGFAVASGGGSLSVTSATTDGGGIAKTNWTLGATSGANTVTVGGVGMDPITFTATGLTGPAAQLTLTSGNNQSKTVGTAADPFVVTVRDAGGNPVSGVTVSFAIMTGGGTLSAATSISNADGQASSTLTLGNTAGPATVTASGTGLTGSPITFTATGTAGAAAKLAVFSGNNQSAPVGTALAQPLVALATDQFDNPVAGVTVAFAVTAGGGSLSAASATTNAMGRAQTALTVGTAVGPNTVTASSAGLTGSPVTFTEAARWLTYESDVAPILVASCVGCHMAGGGAAFTPLTTYDEVRNGVTEATSAPLVVPGDANGSVLAQKTASAGTMYTYLGIDNTARDANGKTIRDWITQGAFNTTAVGPATQLVIVSGNNQMGTVSSALGMPFVVKVMDANQNPVAGTTVTFTVLTGGGTLTTASMATNSFGQAMATLTLGSTAGSNTVRASATGLTAVTFTAMGTAGPAASVSVVSGNNQSATVGTALANPLVVVVRDAGGNPVAGATVTFAVTGGGTLSAATATTNAMGQAQTMLTLGTTTGTKTVTATVTAASPATFTATATAGAAAAIAIVSGNNQSGTVGTALAAPLVAVVRDTNGNAVSGVTVTFAVASGGGSISVPSATSSASGQAQTVLTLGTMAGANTVTATAAGVTANVTFTATGTAGAATQIAIASGNNQSATVGMALTNPFVVVVSDANGNPKSGVTVTFAVTSGGGSLTTTSATTNAMGQAQTRLTVGGTAGTNTVTASAAGLTGSPLTFTASGTTGTATQISLVSGNNQTAAAGTALSPFVVLVRDANMNPVAGFMVAFTRTAGNGTLSVASATTNAQGQASTTLTLGTTAGTNTVTANAAGLTGSPITFNATGTPGAATQVAIVSGNNQTGRVSGMLAMPLVVAVRDANGNGISGQSVAFAITSGMGTLSAMTVTTGATGQAQTMLTLGSTAGATTVTATRTGLPAATFNATARWITYEDDVAPILLARCVSCHMAGGPASFTPLTNYTQVRYGVSFFSSAALVVPNNPGASLLVQKTAAAGSMYNNLGPDTATRDANAKVINDWIAQGAFNTSVGVATQIVMVSGNNQSAAVSTALTNPFVVSVMDANLNPVSGYTVAFAVISGGGSLSATSVATNAQGQASSRLTLGATAGTNTARASGTGLTNSPITFTATGTGGYSGAPLAGSTNPFDVAGLIALRAANVEPAQLSGDGEFLRRVTADLVGRLPTLAEWVAFSASTDPMKREATIDTLLASAEFGTHWGRDIMAAWLLVETDGSVEQTNFETYLVDAATTDKPLSTMVSELAQGTGTGGAAFDYYNMQQYNRYKAADRLMESFAGVPSKCSRCHDSKITGPLDDPQWTQAQNWGMYKFFETTSGEMNYFNRSLNRYVTPTMMFVVDGVATNPTSLPAPTDTLAVRRARFAELFVASNAFRRGTAHRIFAEVMDPLLNPNRFLAQQIADVRVPEVLKASTNVFNTQNTSLKGYLRTLMRSKLYQLTTRGTTTANDNLLARRTLKRHQAEVLQAGIVGVTGIVDSTGNRDDFLRKFGYPLERESITERTLDLNPIQPLTLLNNPSSVPGKVTNTASTIATLATRVDGGMMTLDAAITEIFRRALTRDPTAAELTGLKNELTGVATNKEKLEDVAAVVMASTEFTTR